MRSVLVAGGVAIAGTALGALAYTVVSAPAAETAPTRASTTECAPKERRVGTDCVQVVRVVRGGTGPRSAPEAPAAPAALDDDDRDDDHGDDHGDDSGDDHDDDSDDSDDSDDDMDDD